MNAKSNKNRFSVVQLIGDKRIVTFDNLEDALEKEIDSILSGTGADYRIEGVF